jgi:probable HAF family extracellular repeat protein
MFQIMGSEKSPSTRVRMPAACKWRDRVHLRPSLETLEARELLSSIIDLEPLAANAINNTGQIAGGSYRRESNGTLTPLGSLGGGGTNSYGINDLGDVVGYSSLLAGNADAFLYSNSNGKMTDLGALPGSEILPGSVSSEAVAVNKSDQVVGFSVENDGPHAFLYSGGQMKDLNTLSNVSNELLFPTGINASGEVVGLGFFQDGEHAFLYNNGLSELNELVWATSGFDVTNRGLAINDIGQIAGDGLEPDHLTEHAFLYSNGTYTDLGSLPGKKTSNANAINNLGQVVGTSYNLSGILGDDTAFIYMNDQMIDLNTLLPPNSGWTLQTAISINDKGQIIGLGTNNGLPSESQYYLLDLNSVAAKVSLTYLNWNTDRNGTAANADHRGLDFSYTVNGTIPAGKTIPIAFYWATGTDPKDIISPTFTESASTPDTVNINTATGDHGFGTNEPFQAGNDPARWGTPPANAKDILAIIDPTNLLGESDAPTVDNGRVDFLTLPTSVSDVLQNAMVIPPPKPPQSNVGSITALFSPGSHFSSSGITTGTAMPISEAEVYLGVDHFNFIQKIESVPANWQLINLKGLDYSIIDDNNGLEFDGTNIYYSNGIGPISYDDLGLPALDPMVQPVAGGLIGNESTIGEIINNKSVGVAKSFSDTYNYYYDEVPNTITPSLYIGAKTFGYQVNFADKPIWPASMNPFVTVLSAVRFFTELVGVGYDFSSYTEYPSTYNLSFHWGSNYVGSGGGLQTRSDGDPSTLVGISGGAFLIQAPDGTVYQPKLVALNPVNDQTISLNQSLSLSVHGVATTSDTSLKYSLLSGSPNGAKIDPVSGLFNFTPQTTGTFPVTVIVADGDGHSNSTVFTVTVVPALTPPKVIAGPNGNAITWTTFTRTGSFQDATGTASFKATVNYGDGTPILPLPLNSDNTFNLSHVYGTLGNFTVTVSVSDANGLTGVSHFVVTVTQPSSSLGVVPDAFVTTLYREVLGRDAEYSGLRYWARELKAHLRRPIVVKLFFTSPERRSLVQQRVAPKITHSRALVDADRAARDARLS